MATKDGTFYPPSIANCFAWYDADDASSIVLNGADVAQWNDKSGNGYHLVQGTGALQPEYLAAAIGGKYGVSFSSEWLEATPANYTGNFLTVYAVCERTGSAGFSTPIDFRKSTETDDTSTEGQSRIWDGRDGTQQRSSRGAVFESTINSDPGTGVTMLMRYFADNVTNQIFRYTGVEGEVFGDDNASVLAYDSDRILICSRYIASAYTKFWIGYMGEMILYTSAIAKDSAEDRRIRNYLLSKWSI